MTDQDPTMPPLKESAPEETVKTEGMTMEEMMKKFGGNIGKMKPSNAKKQMRRDARAMRKRMQYIARNPRGKDDMGAYLNHEDMIEVLQCNEALFVMLEHLLKI